MQRLIFLCFLLISFVRVGVAQDFFIQGVNVITGQIEERGASPIHYELYQEGWNQHAQETLFLAEGDFRIGKVKTIHLDLPEHSSIDTHLSYESGVTLVYDTLERMSLYRYTDNHLIQTVEHYQKEPSGAIHLYCCEHFFWKEAQSYPQLISRVLEDENQQIVLCCCFFYNEQGQLIEEKFVGNLSGNCQVPCQMGQDGYPLENGVESYSISYNYSEEASALETILVQNIDNGEGVESYSYSACSQESLSDAAGQLWDYAVNTFFSYCNYFQISAHHAKLKLSAELKLPAPIGKAIEKVGKTLFGESNYLLMGPHFEETHIGNYGNREISDKVRVTFINGILNTKNMMSQALESISESHGGVKVHYVFRPTEGWTWDISRAILIKTAFTLGFRSLHAHLLAHMWRDLIQEMGGIEGGGVILHYAHSLGGSETDRARELLTPEEQKMIRVVTFGSATLVRNVGYQSVVNIVSVNDGVSSFLLEPLGHVRNYFDPNSNVCFHGSVFGAPYWPTDHLLNGPTYGPVLQEMGRRFLAEFNPG